MATEIEERAADTSSWDGPAAMSAAANSDDPAAAYRAICAGRKEGDPALQSSWALPHHKSPGAAPNADGVRNALSRLPQTQGLTNRDAAEAHLQNHMRNDVTQERAEDTDIVIPDLETAIEVRSMAAREIGMRVVPWNTMVDTNLGPEEFRRGAFVDTDPRKVVLRLLHQDPPAGRGMAIEERDDGAYMTFKVSNTARGDEILTLASDGVTQGVSPGFQEVPGGTAVEVRNGRRVRVHRRARLREVSTTWKPVYDDAAVMYVRSEGEEVAESTAPEAQVVDLTSINAAISAGQASLADAFTAQFSKFSDSFGERLEKIEERSRSNFTVPGPEAERHLVPADSGHWMEAAIRIMSGERLPDMQLRDLADLISSDNVGLVPPTVLTELIGVIDPRRPFLGSTRRLATPSTGLSLIMPRLVTRPTVGPQGGYEGAPEKTELPSTITEIDTVQFDMVTKGGAGDLSIQLLKRSSPEFLALYLELLAEAYSIEAETEAVGVLLADANINHGGTLDPEALSLGTAWSDAFDVIKRGPDTIWLSSTGVAAFIDAKATFGGASIPLYSQITATASAAGGITGTVSGLRAVHVPAMNGSGSDVIIGPSSGFAWAEDGTYTLQVDVPAKAGRDVALVGMLWFAALYPAAFTEYAVGS